MRCQLRLWRFGGGLRCDPTLNVGYWNLSFLYAEIRGVPSCRHASRESVSKVNLWAVRSLLRRGNPKVYGHHTGEGETQPKRHPASGAE